MLTKMAKRGQVKKEGMKRFTRAGTHVYMQFKGTGMIHDIPKFFYFRFEWVYDTYIGHENVQGIRRVRKHRQQEERNIRQPSWVAFNT